LDSVLPSSSGLGSCPERFKGADKRLPLFTATKAALSVDTVKMEFNLNGLHNNVVHVSDFHGEDGSIVELNVVYLVHTVFSYDPLERKL
jgi:hypothetical protein